MNYLLQLTMALAFAMPQSMLSMNQEWIERHQRANNESQINFLLKGPEKEYTPLAAAVAFYYMPIVQRLLEQGAQVDARNPQGKTALMIAVAGNNWGMRTAPDTPRKYKDIAARIEMIDFLLQQGANINAQDNDGDTPLMHAIEIAEPEIVNYLLARGARTEIANKQGKTAFMFKSQYPSDETYLIPGVLTEQEKAQLPQLKKLRTQRDKEIQDILKSYKQQPEFKASIAEHTGAPAGVAGIVTTYLFGEEPKQTASTKASAAATGETKRQAAQATVGEDVD